MPRVQMFCPLKNSQVPMRTKIRSDSPSNSGSQETKSNHQVLPCTLGKKKIFPYWNIPTSYWFLVGKPGGIGLHFSVCEIAGNALLLPIINRKKSTRQNSSLSLSSFSALDNGSYLIYMSNFIFTGSVFLLNLFVIKPISQIEKQKVSGS